MDQKSPAGAFSKDDILFLMNNSYGLRHVSSTEHMQKHLEGPLHGDAIAVSRLDTLLTNDEKASGRSKWLLNDVIEKKCRQAGGPFSPKD